MQGPTPSPGCSSVALQCGRARAARMTLPHYVCETPMFMPVGTQGARGCECSCGLLLLLLLLLPARCPSFGCCSCCMRTSNWLAQPAPSLADRPLGAGSVKGLTSQQLEDLGCQVVLGNTYHLENRPGALQ